jgi:hypothetical protein
MQSSVRSRRHRRATRIRGRRSVVFILVHACLDLRCVSCAYLYIFHRFLYTRIPTPARHRSLFSNLTAGCDEYVCRLTTIC